MSNFNPEAFMNATFNEAASTAYTPVPEGEFRGIITKVEARVVGNENPKPVLGITYKVDDENVRQETGMAEPTVRQTIWLDVTESGGLDFGKGKNVGLGRLREAVGQNAPGKPWMPGMLEGQVCMIKVKHSIDKRDNVTINAEVKAVAPLA